MGNDGFLLKPSDGRRSMPFVLSNFYPPYNLSRRTTQWSIMFDAAERESLASLLPTIATVNGADHAPDDRARLRDHVLQAIVQYGSRHHPHVERDVMAKWLLGAHEARAVIAASLFEAADGVDPGPRSLANVGWV